MDLELAGRVAIVTGGSRGIGRAIAKTLSGEGARVYIAARDEARPGRTSSELASDGNRAVIPIVVDTGDDGSVEGMVRHVDRRAERIDVLVNCAAEPGGGRTSVHPGLTRTERTDDMIASLAEKQGVEPGEVEEHMRKSNSVHRIVRAEGIAWLVAFLASPKSSSINGDAIAASGGMGNAIHY